MNEDILDDIALEKICKNNFGLMFEMDEVIARGVPAGITARATIFKTSTNIHYAFVQAEGNQLLADVRTIVRAMQLEADEFVPPLGDQEYFERFGVARFKELFPGKHIVSADDTLYYRTLAPYNPALVRLARIKGEIRGYDITTKQWRRVRNYAYARMRIES